MGRRRVREPNRPPPSSETRPEYPCFGPWPSLPHWCASPQRPLKRNRPKKGRRSLCNCTPAISDYTPAISDYTPAISNYTPITLTLFSLIELITKSTLTLTLLNFFGIRGVMQPTSRVGEIIFGFLHRLYVTRPRTLHTNIPRQVWQNGICNSFGGECSP